MLEKLNHFKPKIVPAFLIAIVCLWLMGTYCISAGRRISSLNAELQQQRSLRELQNRYLSSMETNKKLAEDFNRPKLIAQEDITPAIMNLSEQMQAAGLTETYFKLEQHELLREIDGVISVSRLIIEGTGSYNNAIEYIDELLNGDTYYFIDKIKIETGEDGVSIRVDCAVMGFGSAADTVVPELPPEYFYRDPFGNAHNEK